MRKILSVLILSLLFLTTTGAQYELSKGAMRKMDKTLQSLWPNSTITKSSLELTAEQKSQLTFKYVENSIYSITNNGKIEAYLFLAQAKSKISLFDYMIVFKPDLSILKVKMLVYREEYGGEIGSKRWLKQFIGKRDPNKVKFGSDVQNISGATISARNLTYDVQLTMKQILELKKKGII